MTIDLSPEPGRAEVLAHYGLAVAGAQLMEQHLAGTVGILSRIAERAFSRAEFVRLVELLNRRSLERLRQWLIDSKVSVIDVDKLRQELDLRNEIVHRFFREPGRSAAMLTDEGRKRLIEELDAAPERFSAMSAILKLVNVRLAVSEGVDRTTLVRRIRAIQAGPSGDDALAGAVRTMVADRDADRLVAEVWPG